VPLLAVFAVRLFCLWQFLSGRINDQMRAHLLAGRSICRARVLLLATSLLLGACAATDSATREYPVIFGSAQGANGGAGATSGMSFSW
jgi:hypothetical protein